MDNQRTIGYVTLFKGNTEMCNNFPSYAGNSAAKEAGGASPPFPSFHGLMQVYNVALHFQDRAAYVVCVKYTRQCSYLHTLRQAGWSRFPETVVFSLYDAA